MTQIFQQHLARRRLGWEIGLEASSLDVLHACAAEKFGVGLSLDIPGKTIPAGLRRIPLLDFPRVEIIALWKSRPRGPAEDFLRCARAKARQLRAGSGAEKLQPVRHS